MFEKPRQREPDEFATNAAGNRSESRAAEPDPAVPPINAKPHAEPSISKSTGPRTVQGKQRSKFNALKHGLFSTALILKGESAREYGLFLTGFRDDLRPEGMLENLLVERLATLHWRLRRLIRAETAEISQKMEFAASEYAMGLYSDAWDLSRAAIFCGGLLKHSGNRMMVHQANRALAYVRDAVATNGFTEKSRLFRKLYGQDQDGETPYGLRSQYETHATTARQAVEGGDTAKDAQLRQSMVTLIDREIERLTKLEKELEAADLQRVAYKTAGSLIPGAEVSDRLIRYETHLTREIERILNRLERLQRMRKGQSVAPQVDVNISA